MTCCLFTRRTYVRNIPVTEFMINVENSNIGLIKLIN